jgi:hypothetical protein
MELPEVNKSSAADEPENREKANWMQYHVTFGHRTGFQNKLRVYCYEHARDQGTLGSATGYGYNRTPEGFIVSL